MRVLPEPLTPVNKCLLRQIFWFVFDSGQFQQELFKRRKIIRCYGSKHNAA